MIHLNLSLRSKFTFRTINYFEIFAITDIEFISINLNSLSFSDGLCSFKNLINALFEGRPSGNTNASYNSFVYKDASGVSNAHTVFFHSPCNKSIPGESHR